MLPKGVCTLQPGDLLLGDTQPLAAYTYLHNKRPYGKAGQDWKIFKQHPFHAVLCFRITLSNWHHASLWITEIPTGGQPKFAKILSRGNQEPQKQQTERLTSSWRRPNQSLVLHIET